MLALSLLLAFAVQEPAATFYRVPLSGLELAAGQRLPDYFGNPPWDQWDASVETFPWAAVDGDGAALVRITSQLGAIVDPDEPGSLMGELCIETSAPRDVRGKLFLPKASGQGFLALDFRVPAACATANERDFLRAEFEQNLRLLRRRAVGAAWFRHRHDELAALLGPEALSMPDPDAWNPWTTFREPVEAFELFSGGQALYENLQLERGLPASAAGDDTVDLSTLPGIQVRAIDWTRHLTADETPLDPLARRIPADQHALFFASFPSFVATLAEADRLGSFGLGVFEERSTDARTKERYERQLGLELSTLSRTFGPLVVESVALTGSDPYLRSGSDVVLCLQAKAPEVVFGYVAARQEAAAGEHRRGKLGAVEYRAVVDDLRTVSSYLARFEDTVVVTNSLPALERMVAVAAGTTPALATTGEYRFFRQRYPKGAEGESALLVVPDEAIRRWCSPRWRIASARLARAASALAEEHATHASELLDPKLEPRNLGPDAAFADLGALRLTPRGIHSESYGSLDFLRPIVELPLTRVTEREAALYKTWREGYERAWSNFFDPIGARLTIDEKRTSVDLTVMPLILGTEYAELRKITNGPTLEGSAGDPHADALVQFVMALDPNWEPLQGIGSTLGSAGEKLGVDLLSWLGGWVAVVADDGPFWDEVLASDDLDEILQGLRDGLNELPIAFEVAVKNPLKLALFMTSLRAFVDGSAPGMSEWKERTVGERRFVEITSPGMGVEFSLFYATTPTALILSLNEPMLLRAMEREGARRSGTATALGPWAGAHAALALRGRGIEVLEALSERELARRLRRESFGNLPILNEWRRLFPGRDPVAVHEQLFRERLLCPGGGSYSWNDAWQTMASSVFGHPGEPEAGVRRPAAWGMLSAAAFALTFEPDGLRVRATIERE